MILLTRVVRQLVRELVGELGRDFIGELGRELMGELVRELVQTHNSLTNTLSHSGIKSLTNSLCYYLSHELSDKLSC